MGAGRIIIHAVLLTSAVWALSDKPSPIPSRNKKVVVQAAVFDADTGIACFFNPKPAPAESGSADRQPTRLAVHPTLPIGTRVRVTLTANSKKSVVVTIHEHADLGDRIISVSRDAAEELGLVQLGTAQVRLEVLKP